MKKMFLILAIMSTSPAAFARILYSYDPESSLTARVLEITPDMLLIKIGTHVAWRDRKLSPLETESLNGFRRGDFIAYWSRLPNRYGGIIDKPWFGRIDRTFENGYVAIEPSKQRENGLNHDPDLHKVHYVPITDVGQRTNEARGFKDDDMACLTIAAESVHNSQIPAGKCGRVSHVFSNGLVGLQFKDIIYFLKIIIDGFDVLVDASLLEKK